MGLTIAQKILRDHIEDGSIAPGEFIYPEVDVALGNDITAPLAIEAFEALGRKALFARDKVVLVSDHFTPNKDRKSAQECKVVEGFAKKYHISHYYGVHNGGIEHALLPEAGLVMPGELIIGADSHTCTYGALGAFSTGVGSTDLAGAFAAGRCWLKVPETIRFVYTGKLKKWVGGKDLILYTIGKIGVDGACYKVMEFTGETIRRLPMDGRFTMCNMAIEAGGKAGIIEPDELTIAFADEKKSLLGKDYKLYKSDEDAEYSEVIEIDASQIEPQVALPSLPSNARPVRDVKGVKVDQVVIGSCTNGRISDLQRAAEILRGKKAASSVRLIVIPATQAIYKRAIEEGLIEIFINAGAVVSPPTCGPCLGGHMGVLADGERAIATTNRNFVGRMGDLKSEVYLAGPVVAAASAIRGELSHPEDIA